MNNYYRTCIPYWRPLQIEGVDNRIENANYITDKLPRLKPLGGGDQGNKLIDILFDGSFNYSFVNGDLERDGLCTNALHDNSSDFALYPADLPINDDHIDIYAVIGQSTMEFMDSYKPINKTKNVDILDSLKSFSLAIWISVLFCFFIFALLLKYNGRSFLDRLDQVFAHSMFQHSSDLNFRSMKLLEITVIIFSFIIHIHYCCLIHTDMVVAIKPSVSSSYRDFADTATRLHFPKATASIQYFNHSLNGSVEQLLFNRSKQRGIPMGDVMPQYPVWVNNPLVQMWFEVLDRLQNHQITITSGMFMAGMMAATCTCKVYVDSPELSQLSNAFEKHLQPGFKNLHPWVASDPEAKPIVHAFIKRRDIIPPTKLWSRVKKAIEYGMFDTIQAAIANLDASQGQIIDIKARTTELRECLYYSRKLKIPEVGFYAVGVNNITKMTVAFFAFTLIASLVLLTERRVANN